MGDKGGKKDKEKSQKQTNQKQSQKDKKKVDKQPIKKSWWPKNERVWRLTEFIPDLKTKRSLDTELNVLSSELLSG